MTAGASTWGFFMRHWTADDIAWSDFDPAKLSPEILKVVKAAAMVERNAGDYTVYLKNIFRDDPEFKAILSAWQAEEVQHGDVLGRYAELADRGYDFQKHFRRFVEGYRIPMDATASVRGSLTGELLARCIVETGTSSFYSALRDGTDEPVLKSICHRIAGDEFRHYKTFYDVMKRYIDREGVSKLRLVLVAVGRIQETEDDELAFAYHAANDPWDSPYDRERCVREYAGRAWGYYQERHSERAVNMVMKAIGLNPQGWLGGKAKSYAWRKMQARVAEMRRVA